MSSIDALCIVASCVANSGFCAEALALSKTCKGVWSYEPLWGAIKDNCGTEFVRTRLMYCARYGDVERAKWLLARGADMSRQSAQGYTALHYAAYYGQNEMVKLLCAAGAKLDAQIPVNGKTPLGLASMNKHLETVRILCEAGQQGDPCKAAIYYAAVKGFPVYHSYCPENDNPAARTMEIVRYLYEKGYTVDQDSVQDMMFQVVLRGEFELLKLFVKNGVDIHYNHLGNHLLFGAVLAKKMDIFEYLVGRTVPLEHPYYIKPLLIIAIENKDPIMVSRLCELGVDVNAVVGTVSAFDMCYHMYREFYKSPALVDIDEMGEILLSYGAKTYKNIK